MPVRSSARARKRRFKGDIYAALARVPGALASAHRLELLDLLAQRPRGVQDVADEAGLSVANASQHLQVLAKSGLVSVERRGTFALYRSAGPGVSRLLSALREVAERNDGAVRATFQAYFGVEVPTVEDPATVRARLADPRVSLLDTRPREEFECGHIPGAINAPIAQLIKGNVALARSQQYVVYCRGPYCTFADEAVAYLRKKGYAATRLAIGPADWEAAGEEVARVG